MPKTRRQSKKNNNNPKKKRNRTKPNGGPRSNAVGLSECARDYALALADPFEGPLACVPASFPPIPSWKTRAWTRSTVGIGTQGYGFVMVNPLATCSSDSGSVLVSTTAYTGTGFPTTSGDVGVTTLNGNAPVNNTNLASTAFGTQCRVVAVGLRAWYTGSELDLQGEMYALRQPDNESLLTITSAQALQFPTARRVAITSARAPFELTWIPVKPKETEFISDSDFGGYSMGIIVTGKASTAGWVAIEVFSILEYIGGTVPNRSPSHADPQGFAAVLTAAQQNGDSWYGSAKTFAKSLVGAAASGLQYLSGSPKFMKAAGMGARMALGYATGYPMALLPSLNGGPSPDEGPTITDIDEFTDGSGNGLAPNRSRKLDPTVPELPVLPPSVPAAPARNLKIRLAAPVGQSGQTPAPPPAPVPPSVQDIEEVPAEMDARLQALLAQYAHTRAELRDELARLSASSKTA
jgi:hypothetical protein